MVLLRSKVSLSLVGLLAVLGCDGGTGARVEFTFVDHHHLLGQEPTEKVYTPLAGYPMEALVRAGGGFQRIPLAKVEDRIQGDAPAGGPYWFRFGERWIITSERKVQWTAPAWGRFDLPRTAEEITVPLDIQGLAPWAAEGEDLSSLLVWGSGGSWATIVRTPALAAGAESLTLQLKDIPADQSGTGLPIPLPAYDGTKGDALHLAQVLTGPLRSAEGEAVFAGSQHSASQRGAFFQDGLLLPLEEGDSAPSVTLAAGTTRSLAVDLRGEGFDAVVAAAGAPAEDPEAKTTVLIRPSLVGDTAQVGTSGQPYFVNAGAPTPASGAPAAVLSWSEAHAEVPVTHVSWMRSYTSGAFVLQAGVVQALDDAEAFNPAVLVGPPTAIQIDGAPVDTSTRVGQSEPLVTWTAPTIGEAHGYEVIITRFFPTGEIGRQRFYTTDTFLRVPPGLFPGQGQDEGVYAVAVIARYDPAPGFPTVRQLPSVPFGFASAATSRFTAGSP